MSSPEIADEYRAIRRFTEQIVSPLSAEDCTVQSMEDASPVRWHLAHTTWFFETFVLKSDPTYRPLNEQYEYLFNSYYNTVGKQFPRPNRGMISRPGLDEVKEYRRFVDENILARLENEEFVARSMDVLRIGLNHEQQHQELILTDVKHMLSCNPLLPSYDAKAFDRKESVARDPLQIGEGVHQIGHSDQSFCFDNELPVHAALVNSTKIASKLVTAGEYIEFINDGGYQRPELWLSMGWNSVSKSDWDAPLYWIKRSGQWMQFTLAGLVPVDVEWPVCHVSYFEADAFARWAGKRLPTEFEWEVACNASDSPKAHTLGEEPFADHLIEQDLAIHPTRSPSGMLGAVWQWTASSYQAYPGYKPASGALGEYNGKFMCNQYVLRGGSVATSSSHVRGTYRNFFPPETRWQFSGIRLAW